MKISAKMMTDLYQVQSITLEEDENNLSGGQRSYEVYGNYDDDEVGVVNFILSIELHSNQITSMCVMNQDKISKENLDACYKKLNLMFNKFFHIIEE